MDSTILPAVSECSPAFFGQAANSLTPKGQVAVPAFFRTQCPPEELAKGFMLRKDDADHLNLYPMKVFENIKHDLVKKLRGMDDKARAGSILRTWSGKCQPIQIDSQGRLTLSRETLLSVGIKGPRVLFLGCDSRIELWDPARYEGSRLPDEDYEKWLAENRYGLIGL